MARLSASEALLRAKSLERRGAYAEARGLYMDILTAYPGNIRARRALEALNRRDATDRDPPPALLNGLMGLFQSGRMEALEQEASRLLELFPHSALLANVAGVANVQLRRLPEAEAAFRRACTAEPDFAEAQNNLGNVLKDQGKLDEAETRYRRALTIAPAYAEAHNNLGNVLRDRGRLSAAADSYRRAMDLKPDYVETHINLGSVLAEQGELDAAEASYRTALRLDPDHGVALSNLGRALTDLGRFTEAVECLERAITVMPAYAAAHNNLGNALNALGDFTGAEAAFRRAIEIDPTFAAAYRHQSTLKTFRADDPQIAVMLDLHASDRTTPAAKCHLSFALAKAFEDTGDLARAFAFLKDGNALRKARLGYDISSDRTLFARVRAADAVVSAADFRPSAPAAPTPIFILGMPRSGTSLVEQIVSCHSDVHGAGELLDLPMAGRALVAGEAAPTQEALDTFRQSYLSALARRNAGAACVTDKAPQNFLFIGLIAKALPEARIVHVTRDAKAVCWSNYRQYFAANALGYSYDLADVVAYYRLYADLMQDWAQRYPGRIIDLDYDRLTEDQESETRRLIAALDLPWDAACLAPHKNARGVGTASQRQVRQSVYRGSSNDWKRYEPFLSGAFDGL
ncbi:MAG: tetratricopeptide repeat protein [Paracoccaceae bacterium]|nr:tetratricopeptide repeat protein [Paracoccaceae bacterium]